MEHQYVHVLTTASSRRLRREMDEILASHSDSAQTLILAAASTHTAAFERLAEGDVDVFVMEMSPTTANGSDWIEKVRNFDASLPVVAVLDVEDERAGRRAIDAGADACLAMVELSENSLLRSIYRAIERRLSRAVASRRTNRVGGTSLVRFGCFELDDTNLLLHKRGKPVDIHLTPLRLLIHLVRNADRTISKQELLDTVWSGTAVSDWAISSAVKELRYILGDDGAHQRVIQTQRGRGYRFIGKASEPGGKQDVCTVAVLPFEYLSSGSDANCFVAGMMDALIDEMSRVPGIYVMARTSVMRCGALQKPISEISATLGAEAIVTGTIARDGDSVRISSQLLDGGTEQLIWSDHYDREIGEQLKIESELADAIVRQIRGEVSPGGPTRTQRSKEVAPEAQNAFLRGQYQFRLYNPISLQRACDAFEEAIALSPDFAEAYAHLAICYRVMWADVDVLHRAVAMPKARAAAIRALDLAPSMGKCHAAHGSILASFDWDWNAAASEFRQAVALSPDDPTCVMSEAKLMSATGEPLRAVDRARRAVEADPLNLPLRLDFARLLWWARRYDEALAEQFVVVDMDSDLAIAYADLGASCHYLGRHDDAVASWRRAIGLRGFSDQTCAELTRAYERGGIDAFWLAWIEAAEPVAEAWRLPASWLWVAYAAIGGLDSCFEWLQRDVERRADEFMSARVSPFFDPIRADPRFRRMLDRLGMPED